jgi:diguanylate cyclase (GGDEF)-like protein
LKPDPNRTPKSQENQVEVTNKPKILVVDDMPINITILDKILNPEYEILSAASGKEALEMAYRQIPDLILLDVVMPEMDGFEVCKKLKHDDKTKDIPVIFISANTQEEDESRGFEAGVVDYITKPVRATIVKARVRLQLELKSARDHLKSLSTIDGLTQVANRRKFDETMENEWRRNRRNQHPISLIMMDIDFFKAYNDHYGHLAGDECLKTMAREISAMARRPADLFARYGGEEFVLLLPEVDIKGAGFVARQVQEIVKTVGVPHAYSLIAEYVTLSMGVATLVPQEGQAHYDLIYAADKLLYLAKQNGRNQIREAVLA